MSPVGPYCDVTPFPPRVPVGRAEFLWLHKLQYVERDVIRLVGDVSETHTVAELSCFIAEPTART